LTESTTVSIQKVDKMKFQKAYTKTQDSRLVWLNEDGEYIHPSLTEQAHKDAVDIKKIIQQYDRTGLITHVNKSVAAYGDFTAVNEYQQSLDIVNKAQEAFNEIPSNVRKKFGNDPGAFFEFATDPKNHEELVEMGLAHPKQGGSAPEAPSEPVTEPNPA
jgi:phage internal scaffolding protein